MANRSNLFSASVCDQCPSDKTREVVYQLALKWPLYGWSIEQNCIRVTRHTVNDTNAEIPQSTVDEIKRYAQRCIDDMEQVQAEQRGDEEQAEQERFAKESGE